MYKLSITVVEPNPDYDAEAARVSYRTAGAMYLDPPNPSRERSVLTVDLTDDEFKAIKKAVLECM
jgi:hypothetical protein